MHGRWNAFGRLVHVRPIRVLYRVWTALNERWLNIETGHSPAGVGARHRREGDRGPETDRALHQDNVYYEPMNYLYIRRLLRRLELREEDVLFDIGCGKGRIVCVAARRRLKRVVGVELFEELCDAARANAARLRGRNAPVEIRCGDAATMDYSEGTVFVLYNPFGPATMSAVLDRLRESFSRSARRIRIGYYMPVCEHLLTRESWLERYDGFKTLSASASFWRSKSP